MSRAAAGQYHGDFVAWNGGCLLIGQGEGSIAPHAHYSIQIVLGSPEGLRVQSGDGTWQSCAAAIIPSRARHSIDVSDCDWSGVLFVEPETPEGRALVTRTAGGVEMLDGSLVAAMAQKLEQAWRIDQSRDAVESLCRKFVQELARTVGRTPSDPRVVAAIEYIGKRTNPRSPAAGSEGPCISNGRFRFIVRGGTRRPRRAHMLWRRF